MVFVLDGDATARDARVHSLREAGLSVCALGSAAEALASLSPRPVGPACLLLDIALPDISGLELQRVLADRGIDLPLVFVCANATVPLAVRAMKAGACDFLSGTVPTHDVLTAIHTALQRDIAGQAHRRARDGAEDRYALLTPRERDVMTRVVAGDANKRIADALGLSEVTVKVHRRQVMDKMGAASVADLVRTAGTLGKSLARLPEARSNRACHHPTGVAGMAATPCSSSPP